MKENEIEEAAKKSKELPPEYIQRAIEDQAVLKASFATEIRAVKGEKDTEDAYIFCMSEMVKDSHGTIISLGAGADIEAYNANPVVLWMHKVRDYGYGDYNEDNILGYGEAYFEEGKLMNKVTLESLKTTGNQRAENVRKKIAFGSLRGCSMGFIPISGSYGLEESGEDPDAFYIREWRLFEMSIVTVPSNPRTLIEAREIEEVIDADIPDLTKGGLTAEKETETEETQEQKRHLDKPPYRNSLARAKRILLTKVIN